MISAPSTDTRFRLDEVLAKKLVAEYGTPLYVIDEAHFRTRIRRYRNAFEAAHPNSEITYASKANSTMALIAIAHQEGCAIDVASEGELRVALAAGVPAKHCHLHGNNKAYTELRFAVDHGVGQIIVDNFREIETLASMIEGEKTGLVLRLAPGVDPVTHAKISTGQADTKFGFNIADGSAERATRRCLDLGLPLIGFHCHVGSQLLDPEAQRSGGQLIAQFAREMKEKLGFSATYLNVGGGLGVTYTDKDHPMSVEQYCKLVVEAIREGLEGSGIDPTLAQEPGRSLVGESGVTLYSVGVIKTVPAKDRGKRTYVCVDGGLSDNPRPVMYGSKYTVERVARGEQPPSWLVTSGDPESADAEIAAEDGAKAAVSAPDGDGILVTVSGKHCETDKLFEDIVLPADLAEGDLLQVLVTGAYNSAMASNYNRFLRPATVLVGANGGHTLIQRRETWDELLSREILPESLGG